MYCHSFDILNLMLTIYYEKMLNLPEKFNIKPFLGRNYAFLSIKIYWRKWLEYTNFRLRFIQFWMHIHLKIRKYVEFSLENNKFMETNINLLKKK